jgi:hypothetical protein
MERKQKPILGQGFVNNSLCLHQETLQLLFDFPILHSSAFSTAEE